jgi:hypothetical protein
MKKSLNDGAHKLPSGNAKGNSSTGSGGSKT